MALISVSLQVASLRRRHNRRGHNRKLIRNNKKSKLNHRLKRRKDLDDENTGSTGSHCSIDVREYKEIKLCGCKFKGFNCQVFESFIDITNPDKTKMTPLKFTA